MRWMLRVLGCLAATLALSGCANFKAVSAFANQTTVMTGAVRTEFQQIGKLCTEQAEMRIVITNAPNNALLDSCKLQGDSLVAFQEVTIDTLDLYARTLLAMVDDSNFDLRPSIETTGQKLAGLKTRDGSSLISADKVGAITKVLALLADVIAQAKREQGIRRLVEVGPDLTANATIVREFLVSRGGQSAYDRWIEIVQSLATSTAGQVAINTPLSRQEPIRSAELRRAIASTQPVIAARRGDAASTVPRQLIAALDEWIAAVPVFQREALRPEPKALLDRIDSLRQKALEARQAVQAGF
jgi:hypothetical protein